MQMKLMGVEYVDDTTRSCTFAPTGSTTKTQIKVPITDTAMFDDLVIGNVFEVDLEVTPVA